MTKLIALTVERYRSIKEKVRLEMAPVIIIIGRNGSGKSVLSRLPSIISHALHYGTLGEPIDLNAGGVRHAISYADISHMKSTLPFHIGMEVEYGGTDHHLSVQLIYVPERKGIIVTDLTITQSGVLRLGVSLSDDSQLEMAEPSYSISGELAPNIAIVGIAGFCPVVEGAGKDACREAMDVFRLALPPASYLGPFRSEGDYFVGSPRQAPLALGSRGENGVEILAADCLRGDGKLFQEVSHWFETAFGHRLALRSRGNFHTIELRMLQDELSVSFQETGAGFSQVLPVAIQSFVAQFAGQTGKTIVAEQPELHLHPAIHGDVADLFLRTAEKAGGPIIIETHSEQFIMRIRRRIAEGLDSRNVVIWSVRHGGDIYSQDPDIKIISFDAQGTPSDWPTGVFEESFTDMAAMRAAARKRGL